MVRCFFCFFRKEENKLATTYSPTPRGSTIGAEGLNFSVRNGKRWTPSLQSPDNFVYLKKGGSNKIKRVCLAEF
jgi:hypothetical protein